METTGMCSSDLTSFLSCLTCDKMLGLGSITSGAILAMKCSNSVL